MGVTWNGRATVSSIGDVQWRHEEFTGEGPVLLLFIPSILLFFPTCDVAPTRLFYKYNRSCVRFNAFLEVIILNEVFGELSLG